MTLPLPELLTRARLLAGPEVGDAVAKALERAAGRPVERGGPTDGGPYVYVGAALPEALRGDGLLWFHSVNAGTDALLGAGPWPAGALLTRTVGRMGERIAQYVLAWVLAECQSVPEFAAQHARSEWRRIPSELAAGQTAVVHGTGRIGSAVAGLLRSCGIRTVGVARTPREVLPGFDAMARPDEPVAARWVVAALPLTGATAGYFGADRFAAMGGATFVNVGRGATVDLGALEAALHAGTVGRAVLDVLPDEPAAPGDPCWRLPRTVITSHSAGITADDDVVTDFAACLRELTAGRIPALAVDTARGY
ncbi:NAD(P)-dependent oxidoreductase [Streptomyces sp. NBC_01022]|uniref:NAD(P)-dependent oxidoreductase n=1 Tax=Streptomyces sp. NBC_01022 TaxID=2903723 RepID=UPI002DD7D47B|nr:NAD(P)-dependent oxidoreductase [Streptomyces sp. NBC_01022]WRZ83127.1 D-2-hydroxyacid dehydrogenase [Streptomyces sp. NBC_01022]